MFNLVFFFLYPLLCTLAVHSADNYLTGDIAINCGSTGISTAFNNKEWTGDITESKSTSSLVIKGSSTASTAFHNFVSTDPIPYKTARISFQQFSHTFQVSPATENFNDALVIGRGRFGKVYRGFISKEQKIVAIKRLKSNSRQGAREFWTEVETLSKLQHTNIISLIGYCNECQEMILLYEYVPNGTLADNLFGLGGESDYHSSLSWEQRLRICTGVGRGLDYLHTGTDLGIIHRDIKASNILLDENLESKISDFGLAKARKRNRVQSYVSTNVKGTFGYFDPDYFRTRRLTRKSDTYAFGVVLLEVLCGRPALDRRVKEDEQGLTIWAQDCIAKE
ncbi:receptor kinase At5g39000 isoform X2 [Olea europaea subsp. europaea]|uniref:non-specific serine/threonine protein kinase n=1 Tax=Olea europaea subsp. europaea TaxID=158383 RepID=A0A8S0PQS9_OLEEU|nr:receptor kinase At5g39000 isoform X2 [Olea europaea subsp. europaea]